MRAARDFVTPVQRQWHTIALDFRGPDAAESGTFNPFTDARLVVRFNGPKQQYVVRGFFAADGNAAHSGASAGNVWRVRFAPPTPGNWTYQATLEVGPGAALSPEFNLARAIEIDDSSGGFRVIATDKAAPDLRNYGLLQADRGYLSTATGALWLKGGTNSPENFLAYADFDGTTARDGLQREGEAKGSKTLRDFVAHKQDWRPGDPTWSDPMSTRRRGQGIIGAVNYLADQGMNSVYFLTMNIGGDGHDVWPYVTPDDPTRFDVSKLAQWEILFGHMQQRGILLHMVLQETENERWLDDGDTGPQRQLYYHELIARFAHHPGLVWNLGEENGPADFSPMGQSDQQRRAMLEFFARHDPYQHPAVLHTHATQDDKEHILEPLIGHPGLSGLSFQVDEPTRVNEETWHWRTRASDAGQPWWISMDEIGPWHTGAAPDSVDKDHHELRRHALWGSLLGGAGGVEWYFGAHQPRNDLTADNWRDYAGLWRQSAIALDFLEPLDLRQFVPCNERAGDRSYCFGQSGDTYVLYSYNRAPSTFDLTGLRGTYRVEWFNPTEGGVRQSGSVAQVLGGARRDLGKPPGNRDTDWVIILTLRNRAM
ncbi:MAG: DUF5060 domain-containing protein [Gammaproteobacteria bacterium]